MWYKRKKGWNMRINVMHIPLYHLIKLKLKLKEKNIKSRKIDNKKKKNVSVQAYYDSTLLFRFYL